MRKDEVLRRLRVISISHKQFELDEIGKFHLSDEVRKSHLESFKDNMELCELMYLSTCNRVEFILSKADGFEDNFNHKFFSYFNPEWNDNEVNSICNKTSVFEGENAVRHLFDVASSLDSMVVGEREIITQVRNSFEESRTMDLSGDMIRLVMRSTIETAKKVYTETAVATKPVSIVSLAYRTLKDLNVKANARFLIIGAGQTNQTMAKFLQKHEFANFTVFNRTLSKAENLANELGGKGFGLSELENHTSGFDVILTCTGSSDPIIKKELYKKILNDEKDQKIVIDLAIPADFDPSIADEFNVKLISIEQLKSVAKENLKEREKEIDKCDRIISQSIEEFKEIHKIREVERAMRQVPEKVKAIKEAAINTVFAKEISGLDQESIAVLEKVIGYMEKKYISVPMMMAKEIMLNNNSSQK